MQITKITKQFNTYKLELSWGQLVAIENALADRLKDPVADELYAAFKWYLDDLPKPGEDEKDEEEEIGEELPELGIRNEKKPVTPGAGNTPAPKAPATKPEPKNGRAGNRDLSITQLDQDLPEPPPEI